MEKPKFTHLEEYKAEDASIDQTKIPLLGVFTMQDLTNCEAAIKASLRRTSIGFETRQAWTNTLRRIESVKLKKYRELSINKDYQGSW